MPINKFIGSKTKDKMLPNYHLLSRHMIYGLHLNFVFFLDLVLHMCIMLTESAFLKSV